MFRLAGIETLKSPVPVYFKGTEKNLESTVFPVKNTKFLHTIIEGFLYLVHKK
jgi:hypothetical protein